MQLTSFFAPLNLFNLSIFIYTFFVFDAVGYLLSKAIFLDKYLRPVYWVFGLGIFIFTWFVLHLFIPFGFQLPWISLIFFCLVSFPFYIREKGYLTLFNAILQVPYVVVPLAIIAKPLYFFLSAPPYYTDEMAYHYYSPAQMILEKKWQFIDSIGLYQMIPKLLDTGFQLMFSLSKTYVNARLLHFTLVLTVIIAISIYLKKNVNLFVSIAYAIFVPILSARFFESSILGYVDAGATILATLFLITIVDFLAKGDKKYLLAPAAIFGLTIGIKYTVMVFLCSVILVGAVVWLVIYNKKLLELSKRKLSFLLIFRKSKFVLLIIFISSLFGGYWYIKNLFLTGNPIYPLFFPCFKSLQCGVGREHFAGWAVPLDWQYFQFIKISIFQSEVVFFYFIVSLLISLFFSILYKMRTVFILSLLVPLSIIIEILITRNVSGFELRYFYHWHLLIPLVLALPLSIFSKYKKKSKTFFYLLAAIFGILFIITEGIVAYRNVKRIYEPDFVPGYVRNYSMRRADLNDWINYYYPRTNELVKWCGEKRPMQDIIMFDPALIWTTDDSMMRIFLVNCSIHTFPYLGLNMEKLSTFIKTNYPNALILSVGRCGDKTAQLSYIPDETVMERHKYNMKIICNSKEVMKNVYALPDFASIK